MPDTQVRTPLRERLLHADRDGGWDSDDEWSSPRTAGTTVPTPTPTPTPRSPTSRLSTSPGKKRRSPARSPSRRTRFRATKPNTRYKYNDRFIPAHNAFSPSATSKFRSRPSPETSPGSQRKKSPSSEAYTAVLASAAGLDINTRILGRNPTPPRGASLASAYNVSPPRRGRQRRYPSGPDKVLDAPGVIDDFYLNPLDWSVSNLIALALSQETYVYNPGTGDVTTLSETSSGNTHISAVRWSCDGAYLATGVSLGKTQIWDASNQVLLRTLPATSSASASVCGLAWSPRDPKVLTIADRSGTITHHDLRVARSQTSQVQGHARGSAVSGLTWRADGTRLASGGNDDAVRVWDARALPGAALGTLQHRAAVKALAWSPWRRNLLATGAGAADRCVRLWNVNSGAVETTAETDGQITALHWGGERGGRELLACGGGVDGFGVIRIWGCRSENGLVALAQRADVLAHDGRVLAAATGPGTDTLATVAGDESLKFWEVWTGGRGRAGASRRGRNPFASPGVEEFGVIR